MPHTLSPEAAAAAAETAALFRARALAARDDARFKGSMAWATAKGRNYLVRAFYDPDTGRRRQVSLGLRTPETEALLAAWDLDRAAAAARLAETEAAEKTVAAGNRTLGLARVPLLAAKVLRGLDRAGWFDAGLRLAGPAAVLAYEAESGLRLAPGDFDPVAALRHGLRLMSATPIPPRRLHDALARIDHGFRPARPEGGRRTARARFEPIPAAIGPDGFRVEWVAPDAPPERPARARRTALPPIDLDADIVLERLPWYAGAAMREGVAVDARGAPLRLVAIDPRVFAAADLWLAGDLFRAPAARAADRARAEAVIALTLRDTRPPRPRSLPREVARAAAHLFSR